MCDVHKILSILGENVLTPVTHIINFHTLRDSKINKFISPHCVVSGVVLEDTKLKNYLLSSLLCPF